MDATTATNLINDFKAAELEVTVRLTDGTEIYGTPISVNSKGVNVKVDGKTKSVSLSRVDAILNDADDDADDDIEDDTNDLKDALNEVADSISDGASTAEIAAALSDVLGREITPKELRVHLRALGLGVGKGRKYALSAGELRAVHAVIVEADAALVATA